MPETLTSGDEQQLLDAVKQAVVHVGDGLTPDAAIEKVARASGFGPGRIRLLAHAYNNGQQLDQWDAPGGVLDKLASFPLADADQIIHNIYHTSKQAADVSVHADYQRPPAWLEARQREKVASYQLPPITKQAYTPPVGERLEQLNRAYALKQRHKQALDELARRASSAEDALRRDVQRLTLYFKQAYARLPFAAVEEAARTYLGSQTGALLDMAYQRAHLKEKRAADQPTLQSAGVNLAAAPFTILQDCLQHGRDVVHWRHLLKLGQDRAATEEEAAFRPFVPAPAVKPADPLHSEKAAGIMGTPAVGAFLGSVLSRGVGSVPKTKDDLIEDAWMDLEDPEHANELRKIKAHAMLNSMLTDPDDPISAHDPDKVLQAYNEISQLAPRTAENAASLRPMLRRRLEGHTEPFEVKEIADIEKGIAQAKLPTPNTSLLSDTPDKLLG